MKHDRTHADARLDGEIGSLLAVDPSPEFAGRVRRRIAERAARSQRPSRSLLAGGCVAAGLLIAVALTGVMRPPSRTETARTALDVSRRLPPVLASAPGLATSGNLARVGRSWRRQIPVLDGEHTPPVAEVLIAPDEAAGLELLIARAAAGEITGSSGPRTGEADRDEDDPIESIAISQIEIPLLNPELAIQGVHQ